MREIKLINSIIIMKTIFCKFHFYIYFFILLHGIDIIKKLIFNINKVRERGCNKLINSNINFDEM